MDRDVETSRSDVVAVLAGGLAHELNNLLSANGMLIDLLAGLCTAPHDREILETVGQSTRQGTGLVRQLVWLARGTEPENSVFHPRHLLLDVERMIRSLSSARLSVTNHFSPELRPLRGDPVRVYRGFLDLCLAARPEPPAPGKLALAGRNLDVDEAAAALHPGLVPGPYVVLEVVCSQDAGPFSPTAAALFAGSGGTTETVPLNGNRQAFRVYLPALSGEPEESREPQAAPEPRTGRSRPRGGETVLLAEGDPALRLAMAGTLERGAYRTVLASDGAEAVALLVREPAVEVLVVGADLRFLDGAGVIRAAEVLRPGLPCLAIGTEAQIAAWPEDKVRPPAAFLTKPFTGGSLLETLAGALGEQGGAAAQSVNPLSRA